MNCWLGGLSCWFYYGCHCLCVFWFSGYLLFCCFSLLVAWSFHGGLSLNYSRVDIDWGRVCNNRLRLLSRSWLLFCNFLSFFWWIFLFLEHSVWLSSCLFSLWFFDWRCYWNWLRLSDWDLSNINSCLNYLLFCSDSLLCSVDGALGCLNSVLKFLYYRCICNKLVFCLSYCSLVNFISFFNLLLIWRWSLFFIHVGISVTTRFCILRIRVTTGGLWWRYRVSDWRLTLFSSCFICWGARSNAFEFDT